MKKFWKLLNKTEIKHLREWGVNSVAGFKLLRDGQLKREAESRAEGHTGMIAISCYECQQIATKVGMK